MRKPSARLILRMRPSALVALSATALGCCRSEERRRILARAVSISSGGTEVRMVTSEAVEEAEHLILGRIKVDRESDQSIPKQVVRKLVLEVAQRGALRLNVLPRSSVSFMGIGGIDASHHLESSGSGHVLQTPLRRSPSTPAPSESRSPVSMP